MAGNIDRGGQGPMRWPAEADHDADTAMEVEGEPGGLGGEVMSGDDADRLGGLPEHEIDDTRTTGTTGAGLMSQGMTATETGAETGEGGAWDQPAGEEEARSETGPDTGGLPFGGTR